MKSHENVKSHAMLSTILSFWEKKAFIYTIKSTICVDNLLDHPFPTIVAASWTIDSSDLTVSRRTDLKSVDCI